MAFSCSALLAVWTCPVFLSPLEPLTLQVGDEAFHWHRMSEVERQVATLLGQCHRHDEKLGQLVALLQKLQARVDRADSSSEGGSPPVRSVGRGQRLKGAGAGGLLGSTVTPGGSQAQGEGGPCGGALQGGQWVLGLPWPVLWCSCHSRGEAPSEDRVGQAERPVGVAQDGAQAAAGHMAVPGLHFIS